MSPDPAAEVFAPPSPAEARATRRRIAEGGEREMLACPVCRRRWTSLYDHRCVDCAAKDVPARDRVLRDFGAPTNLRQPFDPERSPRVARAVRKTRDWRFDPALGEHGQKWSVTLLGPTGTGKTMLALELYWRWYQRWFRRRHPAEVPCYGEMVRARRIADTALAEPDLRERRAILDRWCRLSFLLVDELGIGHSSGAWDPIVDVACRRYDAGLATVFASNLSFDDEKDKDGHIVALGLISLSPQLADRMRAGIIERLDGGSLR